MIVLRGLTKRYGDKLAVDDLSMEVQEGKVTGFLGPNGAGKSTTMRMILGLDHPTSGTAVINGRPYASLTDPIRVVGAVLDAKAVHPNRTARNHLVIMARSNGIPVRRVDEVLQIVGLTNVAHKRAGGFSLGMYQRLGVAAALLGDPGVLIFDEPVNGLDPDGVRWIRELVRSLAAEGRTIFISSHLMSEMQLTADRLVIIGKGKLLADTSMAEFLAESSITAVEVRSPERAGLDRLRDRLSGLAAVSVDRAEPDRLVIKGAPMSQVGDLAFEERVRLHELRTLVASLEQAYMELTADSLEYEVSGGYDPETGTTSAARGPAPQKEKVRG
jgi:ABC-2 type transport system ATP-binding protein